MPDSLLIDGRFELLGGGVASTLPQCAGAKFRLAPGFDLSAPQPDTTTVISLLLDGERPVGYRASNRPVKIPVIVLADDRATLAAAVEALLQAIDQQQWSMTWTRAGGLPVVFDCFKAKAASVNYNLKHQQSSKPVQALQISFPALPYLHSDQPVTLTFDSPFAGTVAPPSSIELDNYATVSGSGWAQSSQHVLDSFSAYWTNASGGYPVYSKAISSTDISDLSAITFWLGLGTAFEEFWAWRGGNVTFSITLTDSTGDTVTFGATQYCSASNNAGSPNWQQITIPLPDDSTFDWGQVTAYRFACWSASGFYYGQIMQASVYLNAFTAAPASASTPASTRGWLTTLIGEGTAHAPLAVQFQLLVSGLTTQTFNTAGNFSAVIPSGVTTGRVQLDGPGGDGASLTAAGQGAGASGGGYGEEPTYPLQGGTTMTGHVGAPGTDTTFDTGGIGGGVKATAGTSATTGSSTGAAATDTSTNSIHHKGGDGANGTSSGGGTPAPIQTKQFTFTGSTGSGTITATGAGNCLVVLIAAVGTSGDPSVSAVTLGGAADNFAQAADSIVNTTVPGCYAWLDEDCAGGQTTVAVTLTGGSGSLGATVTVMEFDNVATSSALDQSHPGDSTSNGTSFTSGATGATGQAEEVFIGMAATLYLFAPPTLTGPASPWTNLAGQTLSIGSNDVMSSVAGYKVVSSAGTATYAGTISGTNVGYNALVLTLKAAAATQAGGGGSSAGTAADGNPGSGPTGGLAPTGGGAGGTAPGSAGAGGAGAAPGGGGSGALSTGSAETGGLGGTGLAKITYSGTALASFKTLVAHIPGPDAPASLIPFVSVGNGADTPNGGTEYAVQAVASGVNARFNGTYSILAVAETINSPSSSRTVTLTIKEYEYSGGPATSTTVARTFVPDTTGAVDITSGLNGFVNLGYATLPQRDIAPDNTASYFTVTVTDTDTSDRWLDVLFIDVSGQMVLVNLSSGYLNYFVDVPDQKSDVGRVLASQADRNQAASVLAGANISGGPLLVNPGNNTLLAYAVEGPPSIVATYRPAYRVDRPS
jgi:hypothetical protein